jgi:hypothetical protein
MTLRDVKPAAQIAVQPAAQLAAQGLAKWRASCSKKKRESVIPQTSKSKEIYDREYHAQKFCQERFFSVSLLGCERYDSEPTQRQIERARESAQAHAGELT